MTERVVQATAATYVISPKALSAIAPDPSRSPDRLSAYWLLSLGSRTVAEVGELVERSHQAGQPLATFAMDTEIEFATAADRASFAAELTGVIETLVSKYQTGAAGGRKHRMLIGLHPMITRPASADDRATRSPAQ